MPDCQRIRVLPCQNFFIWNSSHPKVQQYAEDFSSPEDELLKEVADFTLKNHTDSIMLSGHLQGKSAADDQLHDKNPAGYWKSALLPV